MPRDDAPLADPNQPGAIPNDQPTEVTGLPDEQGEDAPLGVQERPSEAPPAKGPEAMPGIPTDEDEPQSDG